MLSLQKEISQVGPRKKADRHIHYEPSMMFQKDPQGRLQRFEGSLQGMFYLERALSITPLWAIPGFFSGTSVTVHSVYWFC